jgi:hypothetical protein
MGSGSAIFGEDVNRGVNKRLDNATLMAAITPLRADPVSWGDQDHKGSEGKKHKASFIRPARRIAAIHPSPRPPACIPVQVTVAWRAKRRYHP